MSEAISDIRPCIECGKVHENIGPFDSNGKRMIDNWRDPHDNHAYYPPSWEDFARSLAEARATAGAVEPPVDWWKRIGEWAHDHAIYTKDRPDTVEVAALQAFLDELLSEAPTNGE